jgi:hypothetical protein
MARIFFLFFGFAKSKRNKESMHLNPRQKWGFAAADNNAAIR